MPLQILQLKSKKTELEMKERFAKLLLGEDMSRSGKGVYKSCRSQDFTKGASFMYCISFF